MALALGKGMSYCVKIIHGFIGGGSRSSRKAKRQGCSQRLAT